MSGTASGADVDLDYDRAYRSPNGASDRVLHAKEDCAALTKPDGILEVDPEKYRPNWNWCKRCSKASDATDPGRAGSNNPGAVLSNKLKKADSLDDLREGPA